MKKIPMCRMIGIKNFCYPKCKKLIEDFYSLAENGKVPSGNVKGHLDGWGVGWYEDGKSKLYKSANPVIEEKEKFFEVLENIKESPIVIIHFRKSAWGDTNNVKNTHPFEYKNMLFAHNGTIYDYKNLLKYLNNSENFNDALDSELYFHLICSKGFAEAIKIIKSECRYTSLTCLFSNGQNLNAFRSCTKEENYYTLYYSKNEDATYICSEPVSKDLSWEILELDKLFVF